MYINKTEKRLPVCTIYKHSQKPHKKYINTCPVFENMVNNMV